MSRRARAFPKFCEIWLADEQIDRYEAPIPLAVHQARVGQGWVGLAWLGHSKVPTGQGRRDEEERKKRDVT